MPDTTPDRPDPVDVRCSLEAARYDIQQARTSANRAERVRVARELRTRLNDLRAQVQRLDPAVRNEIQSEFNTVSDQHNELAVSLLADEPVTTSESTPTTPAPEPEPAPAPIEATPVTPSGPAPVPTFTPPHPTPTTFSQRFDNMIARASFYAGRAGQWIRERFAQNPAAVPIMSAVGTTAVLGLFRNVMGGGAVSAAVETQLTQSVNTMAGANDILTPLQNQFRVVGLEIARVRGDDTMLATLRTLQQNAASSGTDANLYLQQLARLAKGPPARLVADRQNRVTIQQILTLAQEAAGAAPRATVASINIPAAGLNVTRNFNQEFTLTPANAPVTLNGQAVTTTQPVTMGAITVTRTTTGIRIQRGAAAAPASTLTLAVGAPPTALSRIVRVS